jgi:hypothetical protein
MQKWRIANVLFVIFVVLFVVLQSIFMSIFSTFEYPKGPFLSSLLSSVFNTRTTQSFPALHHP